MEESQKQAALIGKILLEEAKALHDQHLVRGSVPVRNNAFLPGKPEKDSKVPGKYKL